MRFCLAWPKVLLKKKQKKHRGQIGVWLRQVFPIAAFRSASSILQFLAYGLVNYSRSPQVAIYNCLLRICSFFCFPFAFYFYYVSSGRGMATTSRLPAFCGESKTRAGQTQEKKRTFGAPERYLYISGCDINDTDDATGARTQLGGRPKARQFLGEANAGNTRRGWDCRVGKPVAALISALSSSREGGRHPGISGGIKELCGKAYPLLPSEPPPLSIFFSFLVTLSFSPYGLVSLLRSRFFFLFSFSPFWVRLFCVCVFGRCV